VPVGEPATWHATLPTDTAEDEDALTQAIIEFASLYGLRLSPHHGAAEAGWLAVGKDRVERIWRREGLKFRRNRSAQTAVVERSIVRAAAAGTQQPRVELRLRKR